MFPFASYAGTTVGYYVGDLTWRRIAPGVYEGTGPRGKATITRAKELVYVRSWARSRHRVMTVWNVATDLTHDAHGSPINHQRELWGRTLAEAKDTVIPVLCAYRSR